MNEPLSPEDRRRLQITSAGMLAGTLMFLGISLYMHLTTKRGAGMPAVSYFALVLLPLAAAMVPVGTMVLRFPRAS